MNEQGMQINCKKCSKTTSLTPGGFYPDGSQAMLSSCCGQDGGVLHQCSHSSFFSSPSWLPLILAGIKIVCPECRAAYDLGVKIEPEYPEAGEAVKNVALFVGTVLLIGTIVEAVTGRKRRR